MGSEWTTVTVAELTSAETLSIGDGYRARNAELATDGLPFARAGNLNGGFDFSMADRVPPETVARVGEKRSRVGDVVFTSKGTVGRFALVGHETEPFVFSPQLCYWRSLDPGAIDPRYLYFWFHGIECQHQLDLLKGQTDMADYVSLRDQSAMSVTLPAPSEQRAIASVLGALDDKIESNRRVGGAAEATWIAQAIKALAIGDTDPVPVGDLIADGVLVVNDGYRAKNSELTGAGIPFLRAKNLTSDGLDLRGADLAPPDLVARAGSKVSAAWDTAFTSKGTVGRITLIEPNTESAVYSPQVCFWRSARREALSPFVLHAWMRNQRFTAQLDAVKGQTDMADYVSLRDQRAMQIDLPDRARQAEVDALAEPLARFAAAARREARTLTAIRDALLPKLVSGQVRVPLPDDPQEQVGAATEGLETAYKSLDGLR